MASGVPSRESFWPWLLRALGQERAAKTASLGEISERHRDALDDIRQELLRRGYSRGRASAANLIETSIDLFYAHVFDGRRLP